MTPFQRKVWQYMRAIYRRTNRWPAYHDCAAEVARAVKGDVRARFSPKAAQRRDLA